MPSANRMNANIQRLETEMQQLVGPFISDPEEFPADERNDSASSWSLLDHLEYVFHVNLQLMVHLHALPDADQDPDRQPTFTARLILLTGFMPASIDRAMASDYVPGRIERYRDYSWLREHFSSWNDKLAGLHFLPEGWEQKVVNSNHSSLGYLRGSDWLRIMYIFTRNHRKDVQKL